MTVTWPLPLPVPLTLHSQVALILITQLSPSLSPLQAEPIRVVVTGAAGQIAYSLLYMISKGNVFGDKQKVILHLLDIPQCMGVLEGVVMELNDCAFPLLTDIVPTADPAVAFKVSARMRSRFFAINGRAIGSK